MPTHRGPARAVRFLPIALVAAACVGARDAGDRTHAAPRPAVFDHVLVVSVDGLRSDAFGRRYRGLAPRLRTARVRRLHPNARCDPEFSVTLPNHTAMLTGRPVHGPAGHDWVLNDEAPKGVTLHSNHGAYVPSIFDVAHDRGVRTALFAGSRSSRCTTSATTRSTARPTRRARTKAPRARPFCVHAEDAGDHRRRARRARAPRRAHACVRALRDDGLDGARGRLGRDAGVALREGGAGGRRGSSRGSSPRATPTPRSGERPRSCSPRTTAAVRRCAATTAPTCGSTT